MEVIHDIDDEDKICACGCELNRIGEEVSEQLDVIPAKIQVIRHIRPKYACENWLFSGTPQGANASALLYSLIETVKANKLEPYAYLRYIFDKLPLASSLNVITKHCFPGISIRTK